MRRTIGKWSLPQPLDVQEADEWIAIPRISRVIPFGYEVDSNNEKILQPIQLELDYMEQAKKHIAQYSYRQVANWLTSKTGRQISHVRRIAEVAQDAIETAKAIEEERVGAKA